MWKKFELHNSSSEMLPTLKYPKNIIEENLLKSCENVRISTWIQGWCGDF